MFHFFVCINLITVFVSCQTREEISTFINDVDTSQPWQQETTEQPLKVDTAYDTTLLWNEVTTKQPLELDTTSDTTLLWNEMTTKQPLELDTNIDTTKSLEEITTEQPLELSTNNGSTQTWEKFTTDETSKERNFTTTTISSANGYLRENRSLRILMISLLIIVYSDFMFFFEKSVF